MGIRLRARQKASLQPDRGMPEDFVWTHPKAGEGLMLARFNSSNFKAKQAFLQSFGGVFFANSPA